MGVSNIDFWESYYYNNIMEKEMVKKITAILDKIKEKETGLSLAQLDIIEKLRYVKEKKKFIVLKNLEKSTQGGIILITNKALNRMMNELKEEMETAFPEHTVEVI
ncbi:hypothetical protein BMS3Abin04_03146 [bacterium BMS3Abin04]|nr:hypothetical protein BMS3Abin04_03146 [bacterium BMS3Abin04]